MRENFISNVSIQYQYFDIQLDFPKWKDKKVLDFGGNVGNLLLDPNCKIKESDYWCIDVSASAIRQGKARFPEAHFIHYDAYNHAFNPSGIKGLQIPDTGVRFDYILAYSIFSHIASDEMLGMIDRLTELLQEDGTLIFTFLVANYNAAQHHPDYVDISNFAKRMERFNGEEYDRDLLERAYTHDRVILVGKDKVYVDDEYSEHTTQANAREFFTYYSPKYLRRQFDCIIKRPPAEPYRPNYPAEMQHACIIKKPLS